MSKMKLTMILAGVAATLSARAADAPLRSVANATNRFEISGMHCDGCANGLAAEFKGTPGVVAAEVTLSNKLAVVVYDTNRVSQTTLVKVAKEAGFQAKPVKP